MPIWRGETYEHNRIRLAYVSSDFREHATSYLAAGMFECHDKFRFEVTAVLSGLEDAVGHASAFAKLFRAIH